MATYTKYENAIQAIFNKLVDAFGTTDTYKAAIATDAPDAAADDELADVTQIAGNNGYTTGGDNITFNSTRTGGTITATAADHTWTASGGNLGSSTTGRYIIVHDDTAITDILLAYWDYGSTFTVATGETFTVDYGASLFTAA
jgi:hypothetical protein